MKLYVSPESDLSAKSGQDNDQIGEKMLGVKHHQKKLQKWVALQIYSM